MTILAQPLVIIIHLVFLAAGLRSDPLGGELTALSDRERSLKTVGRKEGIRKNKGKVKRIVVQQNLILLSLLLYTSDIHALHTLMYNTAFCAPRTFLSGSTPLIKTKKNITKQQLAAARISSCKQVRKFKRRDRCRRITEKCHWSGAYVCENKLRQNWHKTKTKKTRETWNSSAYTSAVNKDYNETKTGKF